MAGEKQDNIWPLPKFYFGVKITDHDDMAAFPSLMTDDEEASEETAQAPPEAEATEAPAAEAAEGEAEGEAEAEPPPPWAAWGAYCYERAREVDQVYELHPATEGETEQTETGEPQS